jgi:antitoxin (DNA-binding transcriptional repressor) of toxin-antitoxin stability system
MARTVRRSRMKEVPLSEIKDDLSRFLREAETQEIVITRHGKPAGCSSASSRKRTGSNTASNMNPRFLRRIEQARASLRAGRGIRLEDLETE